MTVNRMENVGIVVESLDSAVAFFTEPGLERRVCHPGRGKACGG
jgi:hypothetical protein